MQSQIEPITFDDQEVTTPNIKWTTCEEFNPQLGIDQIEVFVAVSITYRVLKVLILLYGQVRYCLFSASSLILELTYFLFRLQGVTRFIRAC